MTRLPPLLVALCLSSFALGACKSSREEPRGAAASAHPGATAKPGSYDDWCEEHAVPESLCTRCNPRLTPAFKATGDWCEEHGLPESQCLKCNPGLKIVRPPKPTKG